MSTGGSLHQQIYEFRGMDVCVMVATIRKTKPPMRCPMALHPRGASARRILFHKYQRMKKVLK